jgi:3D (Asp-Asp-Asp) domain-containing protein
MSNTIKTLCVSVLVIAALCPMKTTTAQTSYESRPEQASSTTVIATVTSYSSVDSCHYPSCVMASGRPAYVGAVACPRRVPLGTVVHIAGTRLVCEDRTAKRFDGRYDIFQGYGEPAHQKALRFGKQTLEVHVEAQSINLPKV